MLPSLKLTAKAPTNGGFQARNLLFQGASLFSGGRLLLVSGRVVFRWMFPKIEGFYPPNHPFVHLGLFP